MYAIKIQTSSVEIKRRSADGRKKSGIDESVLESYARQIKEIQDMGARWYCHWRREYISGDCRD